MGLFCLGTNLVLTDLFFPFLTCTPRHSEPFKSPCRTFPLGGSQIDKQADNYDWVSYSRPFFLRDIQCRESDPYLRKRSLIRTF